MSEAPFPAFLQGRVAVVTGASAGIGKAAALGLARCGALALCERMTAAGPPPPAKVLQ